MLNSRHGLLKEDFQKYSALIVNVLKATPGMHDSIAFETLAFCYAMFDYVVFLWGGDDTPSPLHKGRTVADDNRYNLAKEVIPMIFGEALTDPDDREKFDKRLADYLSIMKKQTFRGDWLAYDKGLMQNYEKSPALVIIGAFGDFLINPACTMDYFNAPRFFNPSITNNQDFASAMMDITDISVEMYNSVYQIKDIRSMDDLFRLRPKPLQWPT